MMYELKKFIFNKRNAGVFGFLVFFLICFIGYNVYMDKHYNESQIKIYQKAYRVSENRMDEAGSEEEMCHDAQFDLRVVGREELASVIGNEGFADFLAVLVTNGYVLQVRIA